jgi:hypothetical protein
LQSLQNCLKIQILDKKTAFQSLSTTEVAMTELFPTKLTARQQQILELIQNAIARTGAPRPGPRLPPNWGSSRPMRPKNTSRPWRAKASSNS